MAGRYRFDDLSGINDTGNYTVQMIVPPDWTLASTDPVTVLISRGDSETVTVSESDPTANSTSRRARIPTSRVTTGQSPSCDRC